MTAQMIIDVDGWRLYDDGTAYYLAGRDWSEREAIKGYTWCWEAACSALWCGVDVHGTSWPLPREVCEAYKAYIAQKILDER